MEPQKTADPPTEDVSRRRSDCTSVDSDQSRETTATSSPIRRRTLLGVLATGIALRGGQASGQVRSCRSTESNKRIIQQVVAAINAGTFPARFDDLVARDFTGHGFAGPHEPETRDDLVHFVQALHEAFPDLNYEIVEQVADTDLVATAWTFTGTQEGAFHSLFPTGNSVMVTGMTLDRIANEQLAESWMQIDAFNLIRKHDVVVLPSPAEYVRAATTQPEKLIGCTTEGSTQSSSWRNAAKLGCSHES